MAPAGPLPDAAAFCRMLHGHQARDMVTALAWAGGGSRDRRAQDPNPMPGNRGGRGRRGNPADLREGLSHARRGTRTPKDPARPVVLHHRPSTFKGR